MNFINQSAELLQQGSGIQGILDQIELVGKTCYKSEPKGGETAGIFVQRMIDNKHFAMLEHGTVYLTLPTDVWHRNAREFEHIFPESLPWVHGDCDGRYFYITTNLRHLIGHDITLNDVKPYLSDTLKDNPKRYTIRFITSRAIANELVRHRTFSFAQESTRYCNYSKDKFNNELTCIMPDKEDWKGLEGYYKMLNCLDEIEKVYLKAVSEGITPQIARDILPLNLKTEICMTGFEEDWKTFFDLRLRGTTGKPHPYMQQLAGLCYKVFEDELGLNL